MYYNEIVKNLEPLEKVQYRYLLNYLLSNKIIFGANEYQKTMLRNLGLSSNQFKKAINWLSDSGLISIEEDNGEIIATLTNDGRKIAMG